MRSALPLLIALSAACAQRPDALSLDGRWEFRFDADGRGEAERWFEPGRPFDRHLQVPGCWDAQGVGAPNDKMRHNAVGIGWYRRVVRLPAGWRGKRVWLTVGGVHRSARAWCNGRPVGEHLGYPTAFRLDLTPALVPGEVQRIVLAVDSRRDAARDPLVGAFDLIDYMDLTWGGIYEHVGLEATGDGWIDDAFAIPDPARRRVTVKVALAGAGASRLACRVGGFADATVGIPAGQTEAAVELALPGAPLWTPDDPHLLTAEVTLRRGGTVLDRLDVRFGLRRLEATPDGFRLNGDRFFLRGYGDDYTFPREIAAPASVESWRRYLRRRKEFGFNGVRHHSTMLSESYLRAADEVGMFVQPELPIAYEQFFRAATAEGRKLYRQVWSDCIRQMRNHPSVFGWCMGNEQWQGFDLGQELYDLAKALDPTRPVIDTDGMGAGTARPSLDYHSVQFNEGVLPWGASRGKYAVKDTPRPLIVHEMSNISVLPDPADIPKYDGGIRPFWLEQMRDAVKQQGLEQRLPAMLSASRRLQASLLKLNLEAVRLNPIIDGHHQWLFRDYWTQRSGFVNQFDEARAITPAAARQFIAPAVLLCDRERVSYRCGEAIPLRLFLSDLRPRDAALLREVRVSLGRASATLKPPQAVGGRGVIGPWTGTLTAPTRKAPARLELSAAAGPVRNGWPIWVFPPVPPAPAGVVVRSRLSRPLLDRLAAGATVVIAGDARPFPFLNAPFKPAWWKGDDSGDHSFGNLFLDHPALRGFPADGYGDLQAYNLLNGRPVVMLDDVPGGLEPIVWCLDVPWRMRRKAYLFEARVGQGRLLFSTFNLSPTARAADPAAEWMYVCLTRYAAGPEFQPNGTLPADWLRERIGEFSLPPSETWLEGFGQVVACTEGETRWMTWREDDVPVYVVRQTDGKQRLAWQTAPAPADWAHYRVTFVFAGAIGWRSQPDGGHFSLAVDGKPALDFPFTTETTRWRSSDGAVTLDYDVRRSTGEDTFGV
ncbi:MAG: hypothetical protein HYU66_19185, partial [Armatimonadetes bacterium]|nr:hypothetical protein [Armatimonadota bacterium]